jgi:uncharacterized protein (TIGR02996 family)
LNVNDHQAFMAAIQAQPLDNSLRCVFADWLDEPGAVEEANRQRQWVGAYEFLLKNFVDPYGEHLDRGPLSHSNVFRVLEEWREGLVEYGGICFDMYQAGESTYEDQSAMAEFFRCLEIVTGARILPEVREQATFSCSC